MPDFQGNPDHRMVRSTPIFTHRKVRRAIEINIKGSAALLETCRKVNPDARLVYSGTRGEYGRAVRLPVGEDHPEDPRGIYELSSLTALKLFKLYHDNYQVRSVRLRLTNTYGERAQMRHHRFGVANWFIRRAIDDETIPVFGEGAYLRDFLYVKDAVEGMLMCASCEGAYGEIFNLGNDRASSFRELAETVVRVAGSGRWEFAPFTPERAAQEPGDYQSDIRKIRRVVGWEPRVGLEDGVRSTVDYYRRHKSHYW
jgi:UDP-glucose 4-epimerase